MHTLVVSYDLRGTGAIDIWGLDTLQEPMPLFLIIAYWE